MPGPFTAALFCRVSLVAAAAVLPLHASPAHGQNWPAKPIRLIVPFAPGGPNDVLARVLAPRLAESLGVAVTADNRAGADGIIGTDLVAKASPDGYTLLINSSAIVLNAHVYHKLPYDLLRDLTPVAELTAPTSLILAAHPSLGVSSVKELIALAKQKPGQIGYASAGTGNPLHLAGEVFNSLAGVSLVHVPYKGAGPAFSDLLAGQVPLMFVNIIQIMPYAHSDRLRLLAQTGSRRAAALPDLPTLQEDGLADFDVTAWFGIWAPMQTPGAVTRRLYQEIAAALRHPEVRARLQALGTDPSSASVDEFERLIREDYERYGRYVRQIKLYLD
jgi:tripartite-type tricarboxylate transporter receptor subunit TctC